MHKKKILLDGFHVSFDSRVLFMKEAFRYPEAQKEICKKLVEKGVLPKMKNCEIIPAGKSRIIQKEIDDEDLVFIFNSLLEKKHFLEISKEKDCCFQYTANLLTGKNPEIVLDLDGLLLIAYGIISEERCRKVLRQEFPEPEKYCDLFQKSDYANCKALSCMPVGYIWDFHLLMGVLMELRETRGEELYRKVMRVIYAGYANLKRDIKKHTYITGYILKEINTSTKNEKQDAMRICAQMLLTWIIMEDLGVEMVWDLSSGEMISFIENYEKELREGFEYEKMCEECEKEQAQWREKFKNSYGTVRSLRKLLLEGTREGSEDAIVRIMAIFGINPRKFQEFELTAEESRLIVVQKEKWSSKIYWGVIIIAQLCKYIQALENQYIQESTHYLKMHNWMECQKQDKLLQSELMLKQENAALRSSVKKLEKALSEAEQNEKLHQKQLREIQTIQEQNQKELSNLKSYIYSLSEENPNENVEENRKERSIPWGELRVLVVGGHPGWQSKLYEKYPNWKFLTAEQKNQISEAMKGKDYIICNTEMLSHSCYYKMLAEKEDEQKILYVHHTNIERGMKELERQIDYGREKD